MSKTEQAISWMENTARNNAHGYDQRYRWGENKRLLFKAHTAADRYILTLVGSLLLSCIADCTSAAANSA